MTPQGRVAVSIAAGDVVEEIIKFALPVVLAIIAWWLKLARENATVGRALCAEISALMEIVEERHFVADLDQAAQFFRENPEEPAKTYHVPIADHYCRVYAGSIQNLGCLDADQAELIVRVYQLADSVVRDVSEGGRLATGSSDPEHFEETARVLRKALSAGEDLKRLRAERAAQPWWKKLYWA